MLMGVKQHSDVQGTDLVERKSNDKLHIRSTKGGFYLKRGQHIDEMFINKRRITISDALTLYVESFNIDDGVLHITV